MFYADSSSRLWVRIVASERRIDVQAEPRSFPQLDTKGLSNCSSVKERHFTPFSSTAHQIGTLNGARGIEHSL
jgi:hypothetical protein